MHCSCMLAGSFNPTIPSRKGPDMKKLLGFREQKDKEEKTGKRN